MNRTQAAGLISALALGGCVGHARPGTFASGDDMSIVEVKAPLHDRCETYKSDATQLAQCNQFKATAETYLRGLSNGDTVCLENGFGDEYGPGCKARGVIVDADPGGFLIEIHDPTLDSRFKDSGGKRVYFANGALIDTFLREKGYE